MICWSLWRHPLVTEISGPEDLSDEDEELIIRILHRRLYWHHPLNLLGCGNVPCRVPRLYDATTCSTSNSNDNVAASPPGEFRNIVPVDEWLYLMAAMKIPAEKIIDVTRYHYQFIIPAWYFCSQPIFEYMDRVDNEQHTRFWMILFAASTILPLIIFFEWSNQRNHECINEMCNIIEQNQERFQSITGYRMDLRLEHRYETPGLLIVLRFRPFTSNNRNNNNNYTNMDNHSTSSTRPIVII